jgi:hypothetical protein
MPSVRIEDEAFSDERFCVLANACQLADEDHARGKMAKVWRACTARQSHTLPESIVVSILGPNGPAALVSAELGEVTDGGVRICGTRGRIEWLGKLRKNARKGGKAKAAKRQAVGSSNPAKGHPEATREPATTYPDPCPPTLTLTLTPSRSSGSPSGKSDSPPARRTGPVQRCWLHWSELYERANETKPTWSPKTERLLSGVLKGHSPEEVCRRMDIAFTSPPDWPRGPYDLATVAEHFDKFARPSMPRQTVSHDPRFGRIEPKDPEDYGEGRQEF